MLVWLDVMSTVERQAPSDDARRVILNKRVVYARDARGKVVGRQLLAVSEARELVRFTPYPLGIDPRIAELFLEYDERFAAHLGLPIRTRDAYTIANVLSTRLWDDGIWELLHD